MRKILFPNIVMLTLIALGLVSAWSEDKPKSEEIELQPPTAEEISSAKTAGKVRVILETEKGSITLELDGAAAPITVANFLNLIRAGFYDGMPFHRVEPGFVIQAGDPRFVEKVDVAYTISDERSPIKHTRGTIAMARAYSGGKMVPNSANTQFYICLDDTPHLDRLGFTAFGKIVQGVTVIDRIRIGDKIRTAKLLKSN